MNIAVEITKEGLLKVKNPKQLANKKHVMIATEEASLPVRDEVTRKEQWRQLRETWACMDSLDFPRKSHEEIMKELKEARS